MMLPHLLKTLCPSTSDLDDIASSEFDAFLTARDGKVVPCHATLLRARCPALEGSDVAEDSDVVLGVLRWAYCEAVDFSNSSRHFGHRVVRLAETMGLRDASALKQRLVKSWRTDKQTGSLARDMLRAYDDNMLTTLHFCCVEPGQGNRVLVAGGWPALLRAGSEYFRAMLGGSWAETRASEIEVHWPKQHLMKLLRFLHGATWVSTPADCQDAVEAADIFGVDALLGHVNDWIAASLGIRNAPLLWDFVDRDPRMQRFRLHLHPKDSQGPDWEAASADADDACFDFHIRQFAVLAEDPEDGDGWVPLHDLSIPLMQRLVSSGLICMNTEQLKTVVKRYAKAKCGCHADFKDLSKTLLPPEVLFNRDLRDALVGGRELSIHSLL
eukprot:TRINITY_DN20826_c0_g1_i1.p1 TRINITY_DN20826_c0_g1~~TRINITY_DN20826_c0_g1_i1.p1  ORF type:complete len:384 (-),score=67.79 TRINITY_DN20826_c0_g1_i1:336-1487(-)